MDLYFPRRKVSEEKNVNAYWACDDTNPKMAVNFPKLYESYLDVDCSRMFSQVKNQIMRKYMSKGFTPNTLMEDVAFAEDNYKILSEMFDLKN